MSTKDRKNKQWNVRSSDMLLNHPFMKVRADAITTPAGVSIPDYTVWESGNVAQVIALTRQKQLICVQQYKHGYGAEMLEFPGGFIDAGETPLAAAQRELLEETGYSGENWSHVFTVSHHPTKESGTTHIFFVQDVVLTAEQNQDALEDIDVVLMSMDEFGQHIQKAPVIQTGTALAYFWLLDTVK